MSAKLDMSLDDLMNKDANERAEYEPEFAETPLKKKAPKGAAPFDSDEGSPIDSGVGSSDKADDEISPTQKIKKELAEKAKMEKKKLEMSPDDKTKMTAAALLQKIAAVNQ